MKTRILSACFIVAPMAVFLFLGGWWLFGLCTVISAIAMWEFWKGFEALGLKSSIVLGYILYAIYAVIVAVCFEINNTIKEYDYYLSIWLFLVISSSVVLAVFTKEHDIYKGPLAALGVLYVGFFQTHVVLVERTAPDKDFIWIIFLCAFGTDVAAYFSGYFFGKHKITPVVSPKKTLEGCIGGVIGSAVLCMIFGNLFIKDFVVHCMFIGLFGSVISQFGDLTASAFKRKMGIKDYGKLIPGHGGMMDRFDSVIFTAPFIYYYLKVFIK